MNSTTDNLPCHFCQRSALTHAQTSTGRVIGACGDEEHKRKVAELTAARNRSRCLLADINREEKNLRDARNAEFGRATLRENLRRTY